MTSAAEISAQSDSTNISVRGLDASGGRCKVSEEELVTVATRVTREANFSAAVGLLKFILMRMIFVLRVVCWSSKKSDQLLQQLTV